ncbi:MAG: hypothetical protein JNJ88_04710 [Planctomycetes bacterium]|nr:hypothetical protein [Planctomycetota bacterium]
MVSPVAQHSSRLARFGQSSWLEFLRTQLLESGELERLVDRGTASGITSQSLLIDRDGLDKAAAEREAIASLRRAADLLRRVFARSRGGRGWLCVDLSPSAAHDGARCLREARAVYGALERANVMIKIPSTESTLPVVRQLLLEGVSVELQLHVLGEPLFKSLWAAIEGLEMRAARGCEIRQPALRAAFHLSRLSSANEPLVLTAGEAARSASDPLLTQTLLGRSTLQCAGRAEAMLLEALAHPRWRELAERGAREPELLWTSPSPDPLLRCEVRIRDLLASCESSAPNFREVA